LTSERHQYLYCLRDFSASHHTGEFLANEIKTILNKIGPKKFKAIVTDNGANVKLARELIIKEYSQILRIEYVTYSTLKFALYCSFYQFNYKINTR